MPGFHELEELSCLSFVLSLLMRLFVLGTRSGHRSRSPPGTQSPRQTAETIKSAVTTESPARSQAVVISQTAADWDLCTHQTSKRPKKTRKIQNAKQSQKNKETDKTQQKRKGLRPNTKLDHRNTTRRGATRPTGQHRGRSSRGLDSLALFMMTTPFGGSHRLSGAMILGELRGGLVRGGDAVARKRNGLDDQGVKDSRKKESCGKSGQ